MANNIEQLAIYQSLSDLIAKEALDSGLYRVDCETGAVFGQRGNQLKPSPQKAGHLVVTLYAPNQRRAVVYVHRLVVIAAKGLQAVQGVDIDHEDGDVTNNRLDNLKVYESHPQHIKDNAAARPERHRKASWEPCVRCGNPDGKMARNHRTPTRISGKSFGIAGRVCLQCYTHLHNYVPMTNLQTVGEA